MEFYESLHYQFSGEFAQLEPSWYMWTDGETDGCEEANRRFLRLIRRRLVICQSKNQLRGHIVYACRCYLSLRQVYIKKSFFTIIRPKYLGMRSFSPSDSVCDPCALSAPTSRHTSQTTRHQMAVLLLHDYAWDSMCSMNILRPCRSSVLWSSYCWIGIKNPKQTLTENNFSRK
jgi:hypothetical protein